MDFIIDLPLSADWEGNSYDLILIIIYRLTKIVDYKLVKVTINVPELAEVIIKIIMRYYNLLNSSISDCKVIFMSKFLFLFCYFFDIKR